MDSSIVSLDWVQLITLIFGTGFVTNMIGWMVAGMGNNRERKRGATYLAVRLATMLEKFAIECAEVIGDNSMTRAS